MAPGKILKLGLKTVSIFRYTFEPGVCWAGSQYQSIGLAPMGIDIKGAESLPRKQLLPPPIPFLLLRGV